jgi:hypothetical protein
MRLGKWKGRRGWLAALVVLCCSLALFWLLREPAWTVTITADASSPNPGEPVALTARVTPPSVVGSGWQWSWSAASGVITGKTANVQYTSEMTGERRVHVTVRSPRGTEHNADVVVNVVVPPYYVGAGGSLNVAGPADDPSPDIYHPDLPYRIADITVDKLSVCRGEKVTIGIRAEHDEGKADWLLPNVGGKLGWTVSMVLGGTKPGRYRIPVELTDPDNAPATGPAKYQQTSAYIELKDCELTAALAVGVRRASQRVEDSIVVAKYSSKAGDKPASYVWDFGDGSTLVTTAEPTTRHMYPNEEQRGSGRRVFTYVIKGSALDASGKLLATGRADLSLRNRAEEDEHTRHRIDLMADYSPLPVTDKNGDHALDVTIRNLSTSETAVLTSLEYRVLSCEADATAKIENHGAGDIFPDANVPPRGSVAGHLVWPADSTGVCTVDVMVTGTSQPSGYPAYASFSMRVRLEGPGIDRFTDPDKGAALSQAMALLHKNFVTPDDVEKLVSEGQMDPAVAKTLLPAKPAPSGRSPPGP